MALSFVLGCAGATRREAPGYEIEDASLDISRAVREAHEELPGFVLRGRHFTSSGVLRLTVAAPDSEGARRALSAGLVVADSIERLVNPQMRQSEVARINAAAGREPVEVSPWTEAMIAAALDWAERSGGAFDPTVGPLMTVWGFGGGEVAVPSDQRIEAARQLVGWSKVRVDRSAHTVFLSEAGMELDLRNLSKGFTLDRVRETMVATGATSGIADFNGDIMFFGPGTESSRGLWTIDVLDPYDPTRTFTRMELPPGHISTAVYYDRAVEIQGEHIGHLIDPRTGYPARGVAGVIVYAAEGVISDILDTSFFVMGVESGLRMAEELHDIEALFVVDADPGGLSEIVTTAGFRRYIKELRPPRRPDETKIR